jgi:outer membrane protein
MHLHTKLALFAVVVLQFVLSAPLLAEPFDNTLSFGAYLVQYDAQAGDISGPFVPHGVNLSVDDVNTLYLAYIRRLTPSLSLELAGGVPPETKTIGKGLAKLGSVPYEGENIGSAKWFSPTVLLLYHFRDESEALRPYMGAGFNYTRFFDNKSTAAGDAANGGPTEISLSDSFGWAITLGISYRINDRWAARVSYSRSSVESDMEANTAGVIRRTTIDFHPSATVLSLGYSF